MNIEKLEKLGFKTFVPFRESERDNQLRMKWSGYISYGQHISFIIIFSKNSWIVEKILSSGDLARQIISENIPNGSFAEIIDFIVKIYKK